MSEQAVMEREAMFSADTLLTRFDIEAQAVMLIENRAQQAEVTVQRQEYQDNARTALMEALTASGHLSRVEIHGSSVEEINKQVINRLLNGWDDNLPQHEKKRRFAEICEELTIQNVHRGILTGQLPPETAVAVISDCPVVKMEGIGYRYANKKGMARSTHLRSNPNGGFTRIIEQISRSNSGKETTFPFLQDCGLHPDNEDAADLVGLNSVVIYSEHDWIDGVVDIQRRLDWFAGPNVLYGDDRSTKPDHVDYHLLRQESARREQAIECYIDDLADLEAHLAQETKAHRIDPTEALNIFKEEVGRILNAVCMMAPEYAEATFGRAAAPVFYQASELMLRGEMEAATNLLETNQHLKQTVTFCGMSITIDEAQKMGLPVNDLGELVEKGKENWTWKNGVCRVEACPTRPGKTQVGPCSVCKNCQFLFDHGQDPTKFINLKAYLSTKKEDKEAGQKEVQQKKSEDSTMKAA